MQRIHIDISSKSVIQTIYAKQMDVGRKFDVVITDNGIPYTVPDGAKISAWYSINGNDGNYSEIDGESAFTISGNVITVEIIAQMLNHYGDGVFCLIIADKNGDQIGIWNIPCFVENLPGADSPEATQSVTILEEAAKKAEEAIQYIDNELENAIDVALESAKNSGEFDGVSVTHRWDGTTLVVTSASGTTSADLKGDKGDKGDSALPPISSSQDVSYGVVGRYYDLNLSDLDLQGRELAIGDTIITADGRLWIVTRTTSESEGTCIARCVANLSGGTNLAACSYATGVLPKGRAKGDVNGDGIINIDDSDAIQAHSAGTTVITDSIALWAAECDGYVNAFAVVQYINKQYDRYSPYAADYYGNWQFDSANGYYYYDIAANGMTADCGCIIVPNVTFKGFKQAIPMSGAIRMCFKGCPTEEILCRILYSHELEGVTVENGVKNSFLDSKGGTPGVGIKAITIEEVGTVLISFTIDGWGTYQAKEGMTWAEWIESEYNTIGAKADGKDVIFPDDPDWNSTWYVLDEDGNSVTPDDVIAADYTYLVE